MTTMDWLPDKATPDWLQTRQCQPGCQTRAWLSDRGTPDCNSLHWAVLCMAKDHGRKTTLLVIDF